MNHLDYNYIKHYNNQSFEAANISVAPHCKATFLCSVWCAKTSSWVDVYYQNSPTYQFIFIASEDSYGISQVRMDSLDTIPKELRNRLVTEYVKVTGKHFPVEQKPKHMTATEISTKELADKYNQMTLANLKATVHNLKKLEEESMYATMDDSFLKKYCDILGKQQEPLNPKELEPDPKNIPVTFKYMGYSCASKLFPPLKSKTSIYWKLEDYKPFDIFTILNNLAKDYAYN